MVLDGQIGIIVYLTMLVDKTALSTQLGFSPLFLDYINQKEDLQPFYNLSPSIENFGKQISNNSFNKERRAILTEELTRQYSDIAKSDKVLQNINLLKDGNTFTITTGHQLNIFTGPLYFLYKIITTVNTAKQLKERYPENNFVPVYWMASEDHDFEEINHFKLFGKKYSWETDQLGAVGRFDPSSLTSVIDELPEALPLFQKAYGESKSLAEAVRSYVHDLFGEEGLLVLDADSRALKSLFSDVIKDDILNHRANDLVESTSARLAGIGYSGQVYPRSINFFYLKDQIRSRIIRENGHYQVKDTNIQFSEDALLQELKEFPERFSPNVILRPLYQETILPNLGYVGGPAEIAYWLQLKAVFDKYETTFPILMPRNFVLYINKATASKASKIGVSWEDLSLEWSKLKAQYVSANSNHVIDLNAETQDIQSILDKIKTKAIQVDKSLEGALGAESNKILKSVDNLSKRIKKAEEKKQETGLTQLERLKEKLFPEGGLQERKDNFLNFYLNNNQFIQEIKAHLDSFDFRFHVLTEE